MELTNPQWNRIATIIASVPRNQERRGRPQRHPREVLDGILWVLRTGAPWKDVPQRYPPYQNCHRRFQQWVLAEDLYERGGIDIRETFIDGSFAPAKKGAMLSAIRSVAKAPRSWQLQTLLVFLSPLTWRALRRTK